MSSTTEDPGPYGALRVSLIVRRSTVRGIAWGASVLLAGALGWTIGRLDDSPIVARARPSIVGPQAAPLASESIPAPGAIPESEPPMPDPKPERWSFRPSLEPVREPSPPVELALEFEPPVPADLAAPEPVPPTALERARLADRLAEAGETDRAKSEAEALLNDFASYTGLQTAFVAGGADAIRAQLSALRVIQLTGLVAPSQELARELKRSYSRTAEVLDAIRQWGILKPQITSLEPSIAGDRGVVVSGTLENPDIVEIRRVRVRVEALDAAGNPLDEVQIRVSPKVLAPAEHGAFSVTFGKLDPATVLRARATVVEWESAVLNAS